MPWTPFDPTRAPSLATVRERPDPPETPPTRDLADPPPGFSDLRAVLPHAHFAIAYATDVNFVGSLLPGYGAPGAWLRTPAAEALVRASRAAARHGLQLVIYDAYRPVRATEAMWSWAGQTGHRWLFDDGWVVRRSRHNTGIAVDLTLADPSGTRLDMGGRFDAFVDRSWTARATGVAAAHRARLRELLTAEGFRPLEQEWWHFEWPLAEAARCDVPYGTTEPPGAAEVP